ncbi:MAG: hypothetical protein AAGE80_07265 [Pseudomonadota bacterium]
MGHPGRISRDVETLFGRADPDFVRFDPGEDGNRVLWVVASHVNVPKGKFAQTRIFSRIRGAKLLLNCAENSWYQVGVGGDFTSIATLVAAVGRLSEGFQRAHFIGHSMGAYLALALAHSFDRGGHFLATSPEAVLGGPATRSQDNGVVPTGDWGDLIARFGAAAPKTPGVTLFGAHDPVDALFLSGLDQAGAFYGEVAVAPHHHGVTEYLTGQRHYRPFLLSPCKGLKQAREKGWVLDCHMAGRTAQFGLFNKAYRLLRAGDSAALDAVQADADWANPGWQALRAEVLRKAGHPEQALVAACSADRAAPGRPSYLRERARALVALGDAGGAVAMARDLRERTHPKFRRVLVELEASGLLGAAPDLPDWLSSRVALAAVRDAAARRGGLPDLAREVLVHLARLEDRPDLLDAAFQVVLDAGLRRSALACAERLSAPGAAGLEQRIRALMPRA